MQGITKLLTISMMTAALSGCWLDDDNSTTPAPTPEPEPPAPVSSYVRITHAVSDAPKVNILANDSILAELENVDYQVSSPWITLDEGKYTIQVDAQLPMNTQTPVIGPAELTFAGDKTYDILAVGTVATIEPLIIENDFSQVTAGNARVQIVHGAANAPMVDIYVTAPGDDLSSAQALATLSFKEHTAQVEVSAGDYQVRITPAGSQDVVFDSGTVSLSDGLDAMVTATDNVGAGTSPVTLLLSTAESSSLIWDADAGAHLRVVHGVADGPAVDVLVNNNSTPAAPGLDGVAFLQQSGYLPLADGDYLIDVAADADNSVVVIDDAPLMLEQGAIYTAIAHNNLANIALGVLVDTPRPLATAAKVRIVHASPNAGRVDIYVTDSDDISNASAAFSDIPFSSPELANTGYVELAEGRYYVTVTPAGSKEPAIGPLALDLMAGQAFTAVALDATGGGLPPQVLLLDDSQP
ncbi:DUF4397 domain-containing protein [Bowmanella yangjiangensis]|uniref:DUF4397 domain-containing protein n=1 Tax=Bowmanella yangjiangensis TaxID=2811230 RepID=A0ABS3CUB8_9ALTE|nr:DUF4397 domain-containing protein [Bowmanella yangjiangensis]MBN7819895.1 DUF4397 domain-containing protein [Bowmanella yangjiangensis]